MLLMRDWTLSSHWYWFVSSWHQSQQHHPNNDEMRCTWGITESTLYTICAIRLSWEQGLGQSRTSGTNITHTPATGLRVFMSHLILPTTPSHVSDQSINFSSSSVQSRPTWAFSVRDVPPWSHGMAVVLWMGTSSGRGKGCARLVDWLGALESGVTAGVGTSLAWLLSPPAVVSGWAPIEALFIDTLTLKLSMTGCVNWPLQWLRTTESSICEIFS